MRKKILNVGCGADTYGTHFVDINPVSERVKKMDADDNFPFPDKYFDEVYSNNLFEHLKNPNNAIREMRRVLKPNGKIVVITDNASYWVWALSNKVHTGLYEKYSKSNDKHYGLYTDIHMVNHLTEAGFHDVKVRYGPDPYPAGTFIKKVTRSIVSFMFRITPMWRMSHGRVIAEGSLKDVSRRRKNER